MFNQLFSRRDFSVRMATLLPALGVAATPFLSETLSASTYPGETISHSAESIHQEVIFKASPRGVYEAPN